MKDKSFFFHRVEIRPRTPGPRLLGRATHGEGAPVDAHHAATVSVLREHQHAEPVVRAWVDQMIQFRE